jgi:hypothetical protein
VFTVRLGRNKETDIFPKIGAILNAKALLNVLALLRTIKAHPEHAQGLSLLQYWSATDHAEPVVLRLSAYTQEQCDEGIRWVNDSGLPDEAKAGLLQTLNGLKAAFAIANVQNALAHYLPQIDSAIAQFSLLTAGLGLQQPNKPSELDDLIREIEEVLTSFGDGSVDAAVADTARKHLQVLLTLLRNVEILGVDAALAAYFELVVRLRRAESHASPPTREKLKALWPKIEQWTGRLTIIEKALESGTTLFGKAGDFGQQLLTHLL